MCNRSEEPVSAFRQALADDSFLFFDGGMGTMLQGAGLPAGASPEEFCMRNPSVLAGIHAQYVQAGADVLTTCTFGGSPFKLPPGLDVFAFNKRMAEVARAAAEGCGRRVHIAGDIGPSGHFARPLGDVEPVEMVAGFREQVRGLLAGGVDTFIVETQFDLAEARAAVAAIRQECDLPVMVSMTFEQGVSLTGSTPEIFAETMQNMGVAALGTNCSAGPEQMAPVVEALLAQKKPGEQLLFVGDGINDAPVLSRADVGVAMGALGSDAAIEAADVVLMTDEPSGLARAMRIARFTRRIVMQNIVFALAVKALVLLLSALGVTGMWAAVFADVGVAMLAILNAMRTLWSAKKA
ncbi:MAG: homocysteine S-methyltransferase family protein [Desulfovibrionaceae bacterium]